MSKRLVKKVKSSLATGLQKITGANHSVQEVSTQPDSTDADRISANDLFSLFTASIIKKKTTFIR
jgi:hypothetical protein